MISRSLLVAALGALVMGLASTATVGGLVSVDVARAQSPAPSAGTAADFTVDDTTAAADPDPEAGLDDTAAGCLDQGGLGGPIDDTGTADVTAADPGTCAATGTDPGSTTDPDAGLDDTPLGGLDDTDLGGPIDDTNQPAADPPPSTTPGPSTGSDGATPPPAGAAPSPASGTSPAPIYVIVNVPSSAPTGSGGQSAPKPKSSNKKHKSSKRSKRRSKRSHSHRRAARVMAGDRAGRPRPFRRRATAVRGTRRR